jgi:iron(III) transport system permease protein
VANPSRTNHTAPASPGTPLKWLALLLCMPLLLPFGAIAAKALGGDLSSLVHLGQTVLPRMIGETLLLCAITAAVTFCIGTVAAWLVTFFEFPLRRALAWAAILPMAMPGYIIGFLYVDSFAPSGTFVLWLKRTGFDVAALPDIRSIWFCGLVLALTLSPYVYMSARAAFLRQPATQIAVARTLGRTGLATLFSIVLPQARPAIAVGLSLVLMETINDIGAVQFFGVNTVTVGVYSTWLGRGDLAGAAQLSFLILLFIIGLIVFERMMRNRDGLLRLSPAPMGLVREPLTGWRGGLAALVVGVPVLLGFVLPVGLLLHLGWRRRDSLLTADFFAAFGNSMVMAGLACAVTLALALFFAHATRRIDDGWVRSSISLASLGYALPGTVLALGILVPLAGIDRLANAITRATFGWTPGLIFSGSVLALLFAYVTRFLVIATGHTEAGMGKISTHLDDVARTLGRSPLRVFVEVHVPLLRPAMVTAALLVFVDAMKELPATLLLRPFNFDTLATHVFTLSSLGQIEESALPALAIVVAGLVAVFVLAHQLRDPASH